MGAPGPGIEPNRQEAPGRLGTEGDKGGTEELPRFPRGQAPKTFDASGEPASFGS